MLIRIITGLLLGLLAIGIVFFAPLWLFVFFSGFMLTLASVEWFDLFMSKAPWYQRLLFVLGFWLITWSGHYISSVVIILACLIWLLAIASVLKSHHPKLHELKRPAIALPLGLILLSAAWLGAISLFQFDRLVMFYAVWVIGMADSGAYFIGTRWGRTRLAPVISPKKSVEGLIGQFGVGTLMGMALSVFMSVHNTGFYGFWFLLTLVMISIGIFGDLFESLLKRLTNIKDSGHLLPGHGGMLDRLDSLMAVLPFYALGIICFGHSLFNLS